MNTLAPGRTHDVGNRLNKESLLGKIMGLLRRRRLSKPLTPHHQEALVKRALEATKAAETLIEHLRGRVGELELLAETDELTGLLNRRGFDDQLQRALARSNRYNEQGVLIYIDMDAFKPINDSYGHAAGDTILRHVADLLRDNTRETDFVGRLGGDEFAVLLTQTDWLNGLARAEKIERQLNQSIVPWQGRMIALSASFGLQGYSVNEEGEDLLARADAAMYESKRTRSDIRLQQRQSSS